MTETAVIPAKAEGPLDLALLKAVGLDRAAPEQRELAIAIAERYGLDLLLKHLVLVEGRPYITRDALLHIAHRSGQFDGIAVTEPTVVDGYWRCSATVYRRDMTHPFTYPGRYPASGGNAKFAPEMAIKVAESMALRRAFNVAAPVVEERWDVEAPEPPAPKLSLAETAARKAAAVEPVVEAVVIDVAGRPDSIVNTDVIVEGVPPVADGLTLDAFRTLCARGGKSSVAIAKVIEITVDKVGERVKRMSDVERGVLADELGLDWRPPVPAA